MVAWAWPSSALDSAAGADDSPSVAAGLAGAKARTEEEDEEGGGAPNVNPDAAPPPEPGASNVLEEAPNAKPTGLPMLPLFVRPKLKGLLPPLPVPEPPGVDPLVVGAPNVKGDGDEEKPKAEVGLDGGLSSSSSSFLSSFGSSFFGVLEVKAKPEDLGVPKSEEEGSEPPNRDFGGVEGAAAGVVDATVGAGFGAPNVKPALVLALDGAPKLKPPEVAEAPNKDELALGSSAFADVDALSTVGGKVKLPGKGLADVSNVGVNPPPVPPLVLEVDAPRGLNPANDVGTEGMLASFFRPFSVFLLVEPEAGAGAVDDEPCFSAPSYSF